MKIIEPSFEVMPVNGEEILKLKYLQFQILNFRFLLKRKIFLHLIQN